MRFRHALTSLLLIVALATTVVWAAGSETYVPTSAERARWTMADMRSWSIVLEAYKLDNGSYPTAAALTDLRDLVQPVYIRVAPLTDAWGNSYIWEPTADGSSYRLVSAGADGRIDRDSWDTPGEQADFAADVVWEAGQPTRTWAYR